MRSRTSVAGGEHTIMRGLYKAEDAREIRSLRQAGSPRDLCEPGTPCFSKVLGASINLCFSITSGLLRTHPRQQRCGSLVPGTPCFAKALGVSINPCFSMTSGVLRTHPRQQRCGSAALHHTSLRSLTATATASLIGSC